MTQQKINKYITETLFKECWHSEPNEMVFPRYECRNCGQRVFPNSNVDFFSAEGFFKFKEFMEKQEYWKEFLDNTISAYERLNKDIFSFMFETKREYTLEAITRLFTKERFAEIAYKFFKEREE